MLRLLEQRLSKLAHSVECIVCSKKLSAHRYSLSTKKGSILIVALWSLFFLGALALVLNAHISPQIILASKLKERAKCYYLAKAGVKKTIQIIATDETIGYDALKDFYNDGQFKELGEGEFSIALMDEERKININKASAELLKRLLGIAAGIVGPEASAIADSILDWRDGDNDAREFGAENSYYQGLSPSYPCKNKDFEVIEELLLVKGINRDIFDKIEDVLTIYGQGAVNINTAPRIVLESLGMSSALSQKLIDFRNGDDGIEATEDDFVFDNVFDVASDLRKAENLSQEEIDQLNSVIGGNLVSVASDNFTGKSVGKLKNRPTIPAGFERTYGTSITFVFGRDKKIRYWREEIK